MLALPRVGRGLFVLDSFLVLFARVTPIAAPLVFFALNLMGVMAPRGRSMNKNERRCVTNAGKLESEERIAAEKDKP